MHSKLARELYKNYENILRCAVHKLSANQFYTRIKVPIVNKYPVLKIRSSSHYLRVYVKSSVIITALPTPHIYQGRYVCSTHFFFSFLTRLLIHLQLRCRYCMLKLSAFSRHDGDSLPVDDLQIQTKIKHPPSNAKMNICQTSCKLCKYPGWDLRLLGCGCTIHAVSYGRRSQVFSSLYHASYVYRMILSCEFGISLLRPRL